MHRTILRLISVTAIFAFVQVSSGAAVPLRSLMQSHGSVVSGPFTFNDFSVKVESSTDVWRTAAASVASAITVEPVQGLPGGLQFSASAGGTSPWATAKAVEISYQLTSTAFVDTAGVALQAAALGGSAGFNDQLVVTPVLSSGAAVQADTQWSSAGPTVSPGLSTSIEFQPAMILSVSDVAAVQPGDAAIVAFVVDNTFVPEPPVMAVPLAGWLLARRRRNIL